MNPYLSILRPVNAVMGFVATIISAFIGYDLFFRHHLLAVIAAGIVVMLVIGGGNILNDIVDFQTDKVNHPERPIASGRIGLKAASYYFFLLFSLAVAISGLVLSFYSFMVVIIAEGLLVLYEFRAKGMGLAGNTIISILVGLIFIFGGLAVNAVLKMIILFVMATLANLSREIIKDIQDIHGDVDRKTFPKTHGIDAAFYLSLAMIIVAVSISYLPYYFSIFSYYYLVFVIVSDALFIYSALGAKHSPGVSQQISKTAMIVGLLAFAMGEVL
ncbi:MAG: UbiA family prenyltransferase [Candidatus Thermoplasmatota archaeon]|nr:UbiA family prenyltransferase [Candidatus Thermoplasmatota archaeon]MCL5730684.1 UbiA family prenyltransferase [Candidatus Thermoplasmatota archaeon]